MPHVFLMHCVEAVELVVKCCVYQNLMRYTSLSFMLLHWGKSINTSTLMKYEGERKCLKSTPLGRLGTH